MRGYRQGSKKLSPGQLQCATAVTDSICAPGTPACEAITSGISGLGSEGHFLSTFETQQRFLIMVKYCVIAATPPERHMHS